MLHTRSVKILDYIESLHNATVGLEESHDIEMCGSEIMLIFDQ